MKRLNPSVRNKRAAAGRDARNYGESELKSMVSAFLEKQAVEKKYRSIDFLCESLYEGITKVLEEYKALRKKPGTKGSPDFIYGGNLLPQNMSKKLYEWGKDPSFQKNLKKICILPKKWPESNHNESDKN